MTLQFFSHTLFSIFKTLHYKTFQFYSSPIPPSNFSIFNFEMNSPDLCKGLVLFHRTQKPYSNFIQINLRNIMCVFKLVSKTVLLSQYHFFIQTHTDIVQFLFSSFQFCLQKKPLSFHNAIFKLRNS